LFFRTPGKGVGIDLRATDFHHGKETGEPSYCEALRILHNNPKSCNEDITESDLKFHDSGTINLIKQTFKKLCDVPLSVASDLETREFDPIGITSSMLIAEQVSRSTCGDRFFFTNALFFKKRKFL
jgi:hypothetical protein